MKCPKCEHEFFPKPVMMHTVEFYCEHCKTVSPTAMIIAPNEKIRMMCGCGREMQMHRSKGEMVLTVS